MKIIDTIYGEFSIEEDVLVDLIKTKSVQRLKGIDQAGYSQGFYKGPKGNRYDHSVGVMLLIRKFGGSIEEQIAGLIHDVSHTAFSHAVDFALKSSSGDRQDFQDSVFEEFVAKSEIPKILRKHKHRLEEILDHKLFPMLERDLPEICADRIDYSLRDGVRLGIISRVEGLELLDALGFANGYWVFKNYRMAK
ncbi:HD domain-containing protein, partial [Candidatus Dojkabacteria bacterium]|nr:HD domain-containing protein [Candidatus Dojkabacteria bacterium]